MLLTQILIKDGSYDDARPHVEYFQRKDPNNPDVQKWVIQLMDPRNTVKDPSSIRTRVLRSLIVISCTPVDHRPRRPADPPPA